MSRCAANGRSASAFSLLVVLLVSLGAACRVTPPSSTPTPPASAQSHRKLARGEVPAYAPSQPVGFMEGTFSVDGNGGASYELPIDVPPGTGGVQPTLSLTYNHHRENGYLGMGWQLSGLSAIGRCGANYELDGYKAGVAFNSADRFCLDGNRLVAVSGTNGADGTVYHTEHETQTSVISHGSCGSGPCSFTATNKSGDSLSFGANSDSRILAQGRSDGAVRAWAIDRYTDLNGNYSTVAYSNDVTSGEYVPLRIDYTGNAITGMAPLRQVAFAYENRTDSVRRYMGGSLVQATKRLKTISTSVGSSAVLQYTLAYDQSAFTDRSRLTSVTVCDAQSVCWPATSFDWQTEQGDFAPPAATLPGPLYVIVNGRTYPIGVMQDFNGDGIADYSEATEFLVGTPHTDLRVWLGRSDGTFTLAPFVLPGPLYLATTTSVVQCGVLQDLNGDGILDYSPATYNLATKQSDLSVYLGDGSGFHKASFTIPDAVYWVGSGGETYQTGTLIDMNGDGLADYSRATVMTATGTKYLSIYKGTGNGFADTGKTLPAPLFAVGSTSSNVIGILQDINGDGIADFSPASVNSSGATDLSVWIGRTPDFTFTKSFDLPGQMLWIVNGQSLQSGVLVDLNGDGIPDYSRATDLPASSQQFREVYLGTGSGYVDAGFQIPGPVYVITSGRDDIGGVLSEMNGDGTSRYSRATQFADGTTDLSVYLGSGSGFRKASFSMPAPLFRIINQQIYPQGIYEDLNGDGMTDFANTVCTLGSGGTFTGCTLDVQLANGPFSDLVSSIQNSFSGTTSLEYEPLSNPEIYTRGAAAAYPIRDAQSSMYALIRYVNDDSRGHTYAFSYAYSGARQDVLGRDWLGFTSMTMTEEAGGRESETTYEMTYPFYGLITRTEVRDGDGAMMERTDHTYADFAPQSHQSAGVHQPLQTAYVDTTYQNGAIAFSYGRDYDYDAYGNMTLEAERGNTETNVLPVYHCARYENDAAPAVNRLGYDVQKKSTSSEAGCRAFLAVANGSDVKWEAATDLRWSKKSYDANENVLREEEWDDTASIFVPTVFTVDSYGNTLSITNAAGATTSYAYDVTYHSFLTISTSPSLSGANGAYTLVTTYANEPHFGVMIETTDPNGNVMQQDVDGFGRPVATWGPDPDGTPVQLVSSLWKSSGGLPYLETRSRPAWTSSSDTSTWYWQRQLFDGLDREYRQEQNGLKEGQPATIVTEDFFDPEGRVHQQAANYFAGDTPPLATTDFDAFNRPVLSTDPSGVKEKISYGDGGLTVTRTLAFGSPDASTSTNLMDVEGRTRQRTAANGETITFVYDPLGQLVNMSSTPLSRPSTLAYDSMGRLRSISRVDTGTTSWTYDDANRLRRITDASGNTISFDTYDALQRVQQRTATYSSQTSKWQFTYDETAYRNGLSHATTVVLSTPVAGSATYHYGWDAYGDALAGDLTLGGTTYQYATMRDPLGRPVEQDYPDGAVVARTYGADENLSRIDVTEPGDPTVRTYATLADYTAMGQLQNLSLDQNGVQVSRRYYPNDVAFGKLKSIDAKSTKQANKSLLSLTYGWDQLGAVTSIADNDDPSRSQTFGYRDQTLNQGMGFLTSAKGSYGSKSFQYEQLGNVTRQDATTYTYKPGTDQIAGSSAGMTWSFSSNGFLETRTGSASSAGYTFDSDGKLIGIGQVPLETTRNGAASATHPAAAGTTLEAAYDHTGRKIVEQSGTAPKVFWVTESYEVDTATSGTQQHTRYIIGPYGPIASITGAGSGVTALSGLSQRMRMRAELTGRTSLSGRTSANVDYLLGLLTSADTQQLCAKGLLLLLLAAAIALSLLPLIARKRPDLVGEITWFGRLRPALAHVAPFVAAALLLATVAPAYADLSPGSGGVGVPTSGRLFFVQNLVNSTVSASTDDGNETAHVAYRPFGELEQSASQGVDNFRFKFSGKELDATNGLYDFGSRRYDPLLGRFISPDPKNQYVSPYLYGANNPASTLDPDGEFAFLVAVVVGAVIGAYFGAATMNGDYNPLNWNWQSGKTWAGLFGGAAIGAVGAAAGGLVVQVGVAVGSIGGTAAQVAGIAIGIAGEAVVGAGENAAFTALGGGTSTEIAEAAVQGAVFGAVFAGVGAGLSMAGSRTARSADSMFDDLEDARGAGEVRTRSAEAPCSCGCSSFVAGTTVSLADGSLHPIEQIVVGDRLAGRDVDTENRGTGAVSSLLGRSVHDLMRVTLATGERLEVTPEHPFFVEGRGWIAADHLAAGDPLATASGTPMLVESLEPHHDMAGVAVHNLIVEGTHDYYVGSARVLVHNGKYCSASIDANGVVRETWNDAALKKRFPTRAEYQSIKRDIRMKARNANKILSGGRVKAYTRVKNPAKTASKEWVRYAYVKKYGANANVPSSVRAGLQDLRPRPGWNQDVDEYLTRIQGGLTIREGMPENQGPLNSFVNSTSGAAMGALSRSGPPQSIFRFMAVFQ